MTAKKQLSLGAVFTWLGSHEASWKVPNTQIRVEESFDVYKQAVQILEKGKFDIAFLADGTDVKLDEYFLARNSKVFRWDPLLLLSVLAGVTKNIGLVATSSSTYNEPFNLARQFASLDHLSQGRAGWNVVTSAAGGENFTDHPLSHQQRYERAHEFVEVVKGLWDSWADDALIQDVESGIWLDSQKVKPIYHQGEYFSVRGPLNVPRAPQGHPVVFQAGASEPGKELGAKIADVIFTHAHSFEDARNFYQDIQQRLGKYNRSSDDIRILPGVLLYIGQTQQEAQQKFEYYQSLLDIKARLKAISSRLSGIDLSELPLDEPIQLTENIPLSEGMQSRQQAILDQIRQENLTPRQLFNRVSPAGHRVLIGTPDSIADEFEYWLNHHAADGFVLMLPHLIESSKDIVNLLIPELQRRGIYKQDYIGSTLRENLGLKRIENIHFSHDRSPSSKEEHTNE